MPAIPRYTGEENLRRIKMQKKLAFVVVEGSDDVPIYESCLSGLTSGCGEYDVVFSGGKTPIKNFLASYSGDNATFIIDRDFDDFDVGGASIVSLDRYSVENYFICEEVIGYALQFVLGCKFRDVKGVFSLDEYVTEISDALEVLIKVLFFYQKVISKEKIGEEKFPWGDFFLCQNNSWRLCRGRIQELIQLLLPNAERVPEAIAYYDAHFARKGNIVEDFPGKMLKHSLQRYIRSKIVELKPGERGKFGDVETARVMLSAVMHRSSNMGRILEPVVRFLKERAVEAV